MNKDSLYLIMFAIIWFLSAYIYSNEISKKCGHSYIKLLNGTEIKCIVNKDAK